MACVEAYSYTENSTPKSTGTLSFFIFFPCLPQNAHDSQPGPGIDLLAFCWGGGGRGGGGGGESQVFGHFQGRLCLTRVWWYYSHVCYVLLAEFNCLAPCDSLAVTRDG